MINLDDYEAVAVEVAKVEQPRRDPDLTDEARWQRSHGRFRDNLCRELYSDSGELDSSLYSTLNLTSTGNAWLVTEREVTEMVNLNDVKPVEAKLEAVSRGRKAADVDLTKPKAWLRDSKKRNVGMELPFTGEYVEHTTKPRAGSGKTVQTLAVPKGDALEVANLLRAAAEELNLGVSVEFVRKGKSKTDEPKVGEKITSLKFQAQDRRKYTPRKAAAK